MSGFIVIDSTKKLLSLSILLIIFLILACVIFIYYFNKYYTRKYKNDFFYLFWGYIDTDNKISSNDKLSLFIYYFIGIYEINSYNFFSRRCQFFPENIKDISEHSLMPNATKGNLNNFEKKHIKWLKFNVIFQKILYILAFIVVIIFCFSEFILK